jgi:FkbM family methyltransferase
MANFSIQEILPENVPTVMVVDIGAMIAGKNRFDGLVERGMAQVIGFEPEPTEYQKLKAGADARHVYLPYFVGSGQSATFYHCSPEGGCSSLYRPNRRIIDLLTLLGDPVIAFFDILGTSEVVTKRLDDIEELKACDLLKIDVQGSELDVLKGAVLTLRETAVVELEVEFVPLYEEQPLFAEVDIFMRNNGFLLHKFADVCGRALRPFIVDNDPFRPLSQVIWANAVYIKDFTRFDVLQPGILLKTAIILHEVYSSIDMVALTLRAYDAKIGTRLCENYMGRIAAAGRIDFSFMNLV